MDENNIEYLCRELAAAPECSCPWCVVKDSQELVGRTIECINDAKRELPPCSPHDNKGARTGVLKEKLPVALLKAREAANQLCDVITHAMWVWGGATKRGMGPETN